MAFKRSGGHSAGRHSKENPAPTEDAFSLEDYSDELSSIIAEAAAESVPDYEDDAFCAETAMEEETTREPEPVTEAAKKKLPGWGIPFCAVFAALSVWAWLLPLRPTYSALEKRDLQTFPSFSMQALFSGDWFDGINLWFSDTFPARENWVTLQSQTEKLYGSRKITYSGTLVETLMPVVEQPAEPEPVSAEVEQAPAAEPLEAAAETPEDGTVPAETETEIQAPEEEPAATPAPADGVIFDAADASRIKSVLFSGDAGYELYNLGQSSAELYGSILGKAADLFAGKCRIFSILCPNSGGIVLDYEVYDQFYLIRQNTAIDAFYTKSGENLIPVKIYDNLRAHNSEYLYFRTDHHWTALGAYYAYEVFCQEAGFEPVPLSEYTVLEQPGFLGSYFQRSQNKDMKANPDTVVAYIPAGQLDGTITARSMDSGAWKDHEVVRDMTGKGFEKQYLCFLTGDHYKTVITNEAIEDDSACLLVKDSYANPFAVYLAQHYHTVVVMDWHNQFAVNKVVKEHNIDDIIVITELVQAQGDNMLGALQFDFKYGPIEE